MQIDIQTGIVGVTPVEADSIGDTLMFDNWSVCASNERVVVSLAGLTEIRTKTGTKLAHVADFFGLGSRGNPFCVFNPASARFLIVTLGDTGLGSSKWLRFAHSKTATPNTATSADWNLSTLELALQSAISDWPTLGYCADGFVMTPNSSGIGGGGAVVLFHHDGTAEQVANRPVMQGLAMPAHMPDSQPGDAMWIVSGKQGQSDTDVLDITKMTDPFGTPSYDVYQVAVTERPVFVPGTTLQPGGTISTTDSSNVHPVVRTVGANTYMAIAGKCGAANGKARVCWYLLDITSGEPVLLDEGVINPVDADGATWCPVMGMDSSGGILIGYVECSSTMFPTVKVTGRMFDDPAGTMRSGVTAATGNTNWVIGVSGNARFVEYLNGACDPDGESVWMINVWANSETAIDVHPFINWCTQIVQWSFQPIVSGGSFVSTGSVLVKYDQENVRYEAPFADILGDGETIIDQQIDVMLGDLEISDIETVGTSVYFRVGSETVAGTTYGFRFSVYTNLGNTITEFGSITVPRVE